MAHTYCGLLDDFPARHGDLAITTLQELNAHLIAAVLFGHPLLINDGYILNNLALREAVLNVESSPLRPLVENGYVKILTRNKKKLEVVADEMAADGITSMQKLVAGDWYAKSYKPALREWSSQLQSEAFHAFADWPPIRIDDVFKAVAETAYQSLWSAETKHRDELARFHDKLLETDARRTEWENQSKQLLDARQISADVYRDLMLAASEAYHYSWGCALGKTRNPVSVMTRWPKHLGFLDLPLGQTVSMQKASVQVLAPDLVFAKKAIKNHWQLLADMVLPAHEVNRLKTNFLKTLETYYLSNQSDQREVKDAGGAYEKALSRHFGNPEVVPVAFDLGFLAASTAAGAAVGGPVGIVIGLGIGLGGVAAAHLGGPQAFWRLAAPNPKGWITVQQPRQAPDSSTSCFQLAPSAIAKYTAGARLL